MSSLYEEAMPVNGQSLWSGVDHNGDYPWRLTLHFATYVLLAAHAIIPESHAVICASGIGSALAQNVVAAEQSGGHYWLRVTLSMFSQPPTPTHTASEPRPALMCETVAGMHGEG